MSARERKEQYFVKLTELVRTYNKIILVKADNVGSSQLHAVRQALRGKAEVLFGKNTRIVKCIRTLENENEKIQELVPHIKGNVGLVFTNGDLKEIKDIIEANRREAPARVGAIAPVDVIVPAQNTSLEPTQTSFLQALNIASKITRGTIEILNDVHLIKAGDKVGASESALLQKLDMRPFFYSLEIATVYDDGQIFDAAILNITDETFEGFMAAGIKNIASVSLAANIPTIAAVPHLFINGYKKVLSVAVATEVTFPLAQAAKDFIADPSKFAVAAAPAAEEAAPAAAAESESESDSDMGFDLFG
ncbi:Ribosomal protein L10/acidic P0 [Carpediemonas membranifera]|uniref:60S acidic ribosomal protein P0 n=1 Tax=Carpediemonas membranifera TaxID=201153 RepID=A0A8J6B9S4_9EUKA|nr:Ribosomal protein L10/acidic P0 [Carpediemonas membranifera]|eukprot:KAG9396194.1 Ribosomal protein L10/acidic P0 [Carpediemonas membranifera]